MAKITVAKLFETVAEVDKRSQVALMQSEDSIQISEKTRIDLEKLIATLRTDFSDIEQTQETIRADKEQNNTITEIIRGDKEQNNTITEIIRGDKEEDNTIKNSFFELQRSFDGLVGTVDILRTDLDNLYQAFYTSQIVRQEQLEKEEDAVFKEQDDLQKKRGGKKEGRGVLSNMIKGKKDPNQIQQDRKKQVKSLTKSVLRTLGLGALAGAAMGLGPAFATDSVGNVATDSDESSSTPTPSREELVRQTERGSGMASFREDAAENAALQESVRSVSGDALSRTRALIIDKEGFREIPYYDVNAFRAGYGSDTYTTESGEVKRVVEGQKVSRADADRDIDRRIKTEFMPGARNAIGPEIFDKLPLDAQAALTSITYNYGASGMMPGGPAASVAQAAKSSNGDLESIAKAVEGLSHHDDGINAGRRQHEANLIRNSRKQITAPQLNHMMNGGLVPELQSLPGPQSSINPDETSKEVGMAGLPQSSINPDETSKEVGMSGLQSQEKTNTSLQSQEETKTSFNFFSDRGKDKLYTPSNFLRASYTSSEEGKDIASLQSNRSPNVSVVNLTQGMDGGTQVQQSRGAARSSFTALSNTTNSAPVSLMIRNTFLT